MHDAISYAKSNSDRFVSELEDWIRIPSISTDSKYKEDVQKAADWLVDHLKAIGIQRVEARPTEGHPIVYAEHIVDPSRPTVLVYGHYDVQPPPIRSSCGTRPPSSRSKRTAICMDGGPQTTRGSCLCISRRSRRG